MPNFPTRITHTQPNDPVSAAVASSAARVLEARTNYLKEVLDAVESGRAIVQVDAPLASTVQLGQAVYWDATAYHFAPALAGVDHDPDTGSLIPSLAADAVGLVSEKTTSTSGTVVFGGLVAIADLTAAIDGDIVPGRYYLSAASPGKLVRSRPPSTVPMCLVLGPLTACDDQTWVLVTPQPRDFFEDHIHYVVNLVAAPAGSHTPPAPGEAHVITAADASLPGWLPATDPSFSGTAPANALFGYNLAMHPALQQIWPPLPLEAAVLELGAANPGYLETLARVNDAAVVFDAFGIWWLTDCYGQVPWPVDYASGSSSSSASSASSASASAEACTAAASAMRLKLSFTKMTFTTEKTVVTSLQPWQSQPLAFVDSDGAVATTGHLYAKVLLTLLLEATESYGGQVLKGITADSLFQTGYAVEGLIAGSSNISLSSTHSRRLIPGDNTSAWVHQELVTVDVNADPVDRELTPQIVVLGDAQERVYKNIPFIGFPNGRDSGVRVKFSVPPDGIPTNPTLKIRAVLFGYGAGVMTDMVTSYYRLARPATGVPTALTEGDTAMVMATNVTVVADSAVEVESAAFVVAAGDTVFVTLTREAAGAPAYNYEMGLIRIGAVIEGA